jgi:hypothetical protein
MQTERFRTLDSKNLKNMVYLGRSSPKGKIF